VQGSYSFYLQFKSSLSKVYTELYQLDVVYGPCSIDTIIPSTFDADQVVYISSGTVKFVLPTYTSANLCGALTYRVQVSDTDTTSPPGLSQPSVVGSQIEIVPSSISIIGTYTFYLYAEISGVTNVVGGPYTLSVICDPSTNVGTITSTAFTTLQKVEIIHGNTPQFSFPGFTNSASCDSSYSLIG
jgi:hypothetical protein